LKKRTFLQIGCFKLGKVWVNNKDYFLLLEFFGVHYYNNGNAFPCLSNSSD
jgi:hypothetical protein